MQQPTEKPLKVEIDNIEILAMNDTGEFSGS